MKYLLFENQGLLDPQAIYMIGASTKRGDDTKIGRFGSGFKFALAKLLREKLHIRIFSGEEEITIHTQSFTFREQSFEAIYINNEKTSLTTEMGPDWHMWQVVRELWCNAMDEGNADLRRDVDQYNATGRADVTRIYLEITSAIREVLNNWDMFFSDERTDIIIDVHGKFKVFHAFNSEILLYRRGIRVFAKPEEKALFHYDSINFQINEERVVKNTWDADYEIARMLCAHADRNMAATIIKTACTQNMHERDLHYDSFAMNDEWKLAAQGFNEIMLESKAGWFIDSIKNSENIGIVSDKLGKALVKVGITVLGLSAQGKEMMYKEVENPSEKIKFLLSDVIRILGNEIGYHIKYPVVVVSFEAKHTLGSISKEDKLILISENAFEKGRREIAMVLIEEQEHLDTNLADETRSLQNHLFSKWLGALEEKAGYFF